MRLFQLFYLCVCVCVLGGRGGDGSHILHRSVDLDLRWTFDAPVQIHSGTDQRVITAALPGPDRSQSIDRFYLHCGPKKLSRRRRQLLISAIMDLRRSSHSITAQEERWGSRYGHTDQPNPKPAHPPPHPGHITLWWVHIEKERDEKELTNRDIASIYNIKMCLKSRISRKDFKRVTLTSKN